MRYFIFIFLQVIVFTCPAFSQNDTIDKIAMTAPVLPKSFLDTIRNELVDIKILLKDQQSEKEQATLFTILIAFLAVVVSCISAYLNYKAFKGQSISNFRKTWNDNLIEQVSEFIILSSNAFSLVKSGVKPNDFDTTMIRLNGIKHVVSFKLKEVGATDQPIINTMPQVIRLIEKTVKNIQASTHEDFTDLLEILSQNCSEVLFANWNTIQKFK